YGDYSTWVRPLDMFTETVQMSDGSIIQRWSHMFEQLKAYL
ncbi:DUF1653 domain-containing protein, partial [Acinetobacter baumannii]